MKSTLLIYLTFLCSTFTVFSQNITIPDAVFKSYLVGNKSINTNDDSEIQASEASAFSGLMNCSDLGVSDLTGISEFVQLAELRCAGNQLTELNLSANTKLRRLDCNRNLIDSLNITQCTELQRVLCAGNKLTSIDVSNNVLITDFRCNTNELSRLDITQNVKLTNFECLGNNLTELDLTKNIAIERVVCRGNDLTAVDVSKNVKLERFYCQDNPITSLDFSNNILLDEFYCQRNMLTALNVANGNNTNMADGSFRVSENPDLRFITVDDTVYSKANWTHVDAGVTFITAVKPFVMICKTDNTGESNDNQMHIPTEGTGYDYIIDWGDGTMYTNVQGDTIHTYANVGEYTITISGQFPRIFFERKGDAEKVLSIEQWGNGAWANMYRAFDGCSNLVINATDAPDLSNVEDISNLFAKAEKLNTDLNHWDVSNVKKMRAVFFQAKAFNGNINDWEVGSVTELASMFNGATAFNQDITKWDVSKVTDFDGMFTGATVFNQAIGSWSVDAAIRMERMFNRASAFNQDLNNWDVSKVLTMSSMFEGASKFEGNISGWNTQSLRIASRMFLLAFRFNGDLSGWTTDNLSITQDMFNRAIKFNQDISGWNMSKVTNMLGMFYSATAFDQNIGEWDISKVTSLKETFDESGLSQPNYDSMLISWSQLPLQQNVVLGAQTTHFCGGENARTVLVNTFNWVIDDAGKDCALGIEDNSGAVTTSVYPNPTSAFLTINQPQQWTLYSPQGNVLQNGGGENIDLTHYKSGIYFLTLENGQRLTVVKN